MIEGSRIDHAGHQKRLDRVIYETIEFDRSVQTVLAWAAEHPDTLVIVTADHETGGLRIEASRTPNRAGEYPPVSWATDGHTAANVSVYAWGPNAENVRGTIDNTDIYRIMTLGSGEVWQVILF